MLNGVLRSINGLAHFTPTSATVLTGPSLSDVLPHSFGAEPRLVY